MSCFLLSSAWTLDNWQCKSRKKSITHSLFLAIYVLLIYFCTLNYHIIINLINTTITLEESPSPQPHTEVWGLWGSHGSVGLVGLSRQWGVHKNTMSYTRLLYHIVICTKYRVPSISLEYDRELYAFILEMCKRRDVVLYRIGGMPDHIHLLVALPTTMAMAKFVQQVKAVSSAWLKANPHFPLFTSWSKEYAAFSYSIKEKNNVYNYIKYQKRHHINQTFVEEYREFLTEHGIEIDERFFLTD